MDGSAVIALHELITLWRRAGGSFHGPRVETGTMPEARLLPFLQALVGEDHVDAVTARVDKMLEKEA